MSRKQIFALMKYWPIGIIVAVWLVFAYPYWGKGLVPFPSRYLVTFFAPWSSTYGMPVKNNAMPDVITQIYPWKRVTIDAWKHGEVPLWNPYSFSGTAHAGNYQSAVFSPVNLLFFLLPELHAWSLMILLQPVLAAWFMMLFLRSLGISREGSVIGSIAFMFCGFIVVWMAYGTLGFAVLFLPLILYAINIFVRYGNKWTATGVAAAVCTSLLSGHFQMSVYVLLYAVSFLVYLTVRGQKRRRIWFALLFVLLGVGLAAVQIVTGFTAYAGAVRSSLFLKGEVIPWQYIATLFSPDFYGNPVTRNDWFGHYAEWASYIGVTALLLAFLAIAANHKTAVIRYFIVTTVIPLLLAFQTPLVDLLFAMKIPVLSTSSASRIIILVSFSLAVLSGFGIDVLREAWAKRIGKRVLLWAVGSMVCVGVVWVVLLVLRPLPGDKLVIAVRNMYLPTALMGITLAVAGAGFLLPKRLLVLLPVVLIVLAGADSYRFAAKWMPFDEKAFVYPTLPVITKTQALIAGEHGRVFGNIGNEAGSAFGIPLIEGYDAVYQERYGRFITAVSTGVPGTPERSVVRFDKSGKYAEDVLQLLGVRYYMHKKSDGRFPWAYPFWEFPQYNRVWEDEHFEIMENTKSLPRVFLASSYAIAKTDTEILDALFSKHINRRETLVLERTPVFDPQEGVGTATISSYRPTEVVIQTASVVPKLLFLSDVYDPGWKVSVDGVPVALYRADFDFRAVAVPEGTHIVRMWYWPASITIGFVIAGFATLTIAGFLLRKDEL